MIFPNRHWYLVENGKKRKSVCWQSLVRVTVRKKKVICGPCPITLVDTIDNSVE